MYPTHTLSFISVISNDNTLDVYYPLYASVYRYVH